MNQTCITEDSKGIVCGAPGAWELVVDGQTVPLCKACYQRALAGDFGHFEVARATAVGGCPPDESSEQQMRMMLTGFRPVACREPDLPGSLKLACAVQQQVWPQTTDARVWADEWAKSYANHPEIAADAGAMIGWFANAIMAGVDAGKMPPPAGVVGSVPWEIVAAELADALERLDALYRSEQDPDAPVTRPEFLRHAWQRYHRALADKSNAERSGSKS